MARRLINLYDLERYAVTIGGHRYIPWVSLPEVPTAQVEVPGVWKRGESGRYVCSACGRYSAKTRTRYCPQCGAKMEGHV